jgi:hypothetical protein
MTHLERRGAFYVACMVIGIVLMLIIQTWSYLLS